MAVSLQMLVGALICAVIVMGDTNTSQQFNFGHSHGKNKTSIKANELKLASWNVNGLNKTTQYLLASNTYDITAIQEIHNTYFNYNTWNSLINSSNNISNIIKSKPPPENDKHSGVALLLNDKVNKSIIKSGTSSSRTVWIKLKTNFSNILVIGVYIPYYHHKTIKYEDTIAEVKNIIYQNSTYHDNIILTGDLNGKIGKKHILTGKYGTHIRSNDIGKAIEAFMEEFNLYAVNTRFRPRKNQSNITYRKGKIFGQIDYILCSKRYVSGFRQCRVNWEWSKLKYGRKYDHGTVETWFSFKLADYSKFSTPNNDSKINSNYFKIENFRNTFNKLTQIKYPNVIINENSHINNTQYGNAGNRTEEQKQLVRETYDTLWNSFNDLDIICFTDGASRGNPGASGAGSLALFGKHTQNYIESAVALGKSTNNISELFAIGQIIRILLYNKLANMYTNNLTKNIHILTDSRYSIGILSKNWKVNSNKTLIQWVKNDLKQLSNTFNVYFHWVGGHSDIGYNEHVDSLANKGADLSEYADFVQPNIQIPPNIMDIHRTQNYYNNILITDIDSFIVNNSILFEPSNASLNRSIISNQPSDISDNDILSNSFNNYITTASGPNKNEFIQLTQNIKSIYNDTVAECKTDIDLFEQGKLHHINKTINISKGLELLHQRKQAIMAKNNSQIKQLNKELATLKYEEWTAYIDRNVTVMEQAAENNDTKSLYQIANKLAKSDTKSKLIKPKIDEETGTKLESTTDIINFFHKHLVEANKPVENINDYLNIEIIDINDSEAFDEDEFNYLFDTAISMMKNGKATGPLSIPIEVYKNNTILRLELKGIIKNIWIYEVFPDEYANGDTLMFYKKGSINSFGNYRPLTMLNHEFKVLSRMVLLDISVAIEAELGDQHNGFRPDRGARDNLLILRWTIHLILKNEEEKGVLFVDFKGAFPSMAHNPIIKSLLSFRNLKRKSIRLVKLILQEAKLRYKFDNYNYSDWVAVCRGILQGDIVNPILFCVTLHHIIISQNLFENKIAILNMIENEHILNSVTSDDETSIELSESSITLESLVTLKSSIIESEYEYESSESSDALENISESSITSKNVSILSQISSEISSEISSYDFVEDWSNKPLDIKDLLYADDLADVIDDHKMGSEDLHALNDAVRNTNSGLIIHPGKTETLIVSKQKFKVSKTTEEDCKNMGWKAKCKYCNKIFPGYSSLPGHYRWCTAENPHPNGSRYRTIADKLVKEKKIEKILNDELPHIDFQDNIIKNKFSVIYLGSLFTMNGDITNEIRRRIGIASGAFRKYYCLFINGKLLLSIKLRLYAALIISIVLFGFESWPNITEHIRKISRMTTGHKLLIKGIKPKGNEFKRHWDKENKNLLQQIKERKLKYLYKIYDDESGCKKLKEFVRKDIDNPFFEFININNHLKMKSDAMKLSESEFISKYK